MSTPVEVYAGIPVPAGWHPIAYYEEALSIALRKLTRARSHTEFQRLRECVNRLAVARRAAITRLIGIASPNAPLDEGRGPYSGYLLNS